MKIALSTESTVDLTEEIIKENEIHVLPGIVILGDKTYLDGVDINPLQIFEYVDQNKILPKTAAINVYQFEEYFTGLLKDHDAVIHVCLSSGISSTCANAIAASQTDGLKGKVFVVDSKSLSTGIALLVLYARKLINQGLDVSEVYEEVVKRVPHVQASFVINTVDYLYKGGRCSGVAAFAAAVFRIKPQIIVDGGKMHPGKKYSGRGVAVVKKYCEDTLAEFKNPDLSIGFVTHSHATPEMVEVAMEAMRKRGFKKIYETTAGCTISSHCGPKTLGILYINDGGDN